MKKIGLYVHIPFCVSKCLYCNFYSKPCNEEIKENYILALIKEFEQVSKNASNCGVNTIFIGGGTPSTLKSGSISLILNVIKNHYNVLPNAEITIEANPNTINHSLASEWFLAGVNRISVGLQTSNNNILKLIGRTHTFSDYLNSIDILQKVGFKNINTDVMIGLPRQKQSDLRHTLTHIAKLNIKHISAYTLILEEDTKLFQMIEKGELKLPKEEKVLGMFNYLLKILNKFGYYRYEVSNFCLPGFECNHNYNCWKLDEYIGFGASAHSYFNGIRYSNLNSIEQYIENINLNKSVINEEMKLSKQEKLEEKLMLGLRLTEGVNLDEIKKEFKIDLITSKKDEINNLLKLNLIKIANNKLMATTEGFYVLNQIILELIN